ncbi:MAG: protein-disulfide reductase DsbD [Gammaproteobacteria bacterium]|nr:protein-disulfide reductase DsbD [Gammaproteobacteria bacterium]
MDNRKHPSVNLGLLALLWGLLAWPLAATAQLGQTIDEGEASATESVLAEGEKEFLLPDQAFVMRGTQDAEGRLQLSWEIADGYYMYRAKIEFRSSVEGVGFGAVDFPEAVMKHDEYFGEMAIFKHQLEIDVPVARTGADVPDAVEVTVTYQGCADGGICYPPMRKKVPFDFGKLSPAAAAAAATAVANNAIAAPAAADEEVELNEADKIAGMLKGNSAWQALLTFYGFGLLLSLTPCVFPMIPILSGIIAGQGTKLSTSGALFLSAVYVVSMAVAYAIAGVIAGLFGHNLQASFQHPVALITFSAVFVALALSMFGLYKLQLPAAITNRLESVSRGRQGGSAFGVAIMGFISAIIVGPCVAPPLAGALMYIGKEGDPLLGGGALFMLGMGMGTPLLAVGTSAGSLLPRAGMWMVKVQYVFGVMMLGVAVWFLSRIIPPAATLALWGLLLLGTSIYLGAFDSLAAEASGWVRLLKGLGLAMACYGTVLIIGAAAGGESVLQPLKSFAGGGVGGAATAAAKPTFIRVATVAELDGQLASAKAAGKTAMLDFYADWCVECKEMEHKTFSKPAVLAEFDKMVVLQADVTKNDDADQALLKKYELIGPPAILFYDISGKERRELRVVGFADEQKFLARLTKLQAP